MISQGPKHDAEVAHRALLRHIKTLKAKIEGYEDNVTRLHGILRKGGVKANTQDQLEAASIHKDRKVSGAARDILDLDESIKRNEAILQAKEQAERALARMLSYSDSFFLKGAEDEHLDTERHNYLVGKRGGKSAAEKADCVALGIASGKEEKEADEEEYGGAGADGKRKRAAGGAGGK